jgi:hypothetical protein
LYLVLSKLVTDLDRPVSVGPMFAQEERGDSKPKRPTRLGCVINSTSLMRGRHYLDVFRAHPPSQRYLGRLRPAAHVTVTNLTWDDVAHLAARASLTPPRPYENTMSAHEAASAVVG